MNSKIETILFCGYGRAGKDEAASTLGRITHLPYAGSYSWAVLPLVAKSLGLHPQVAWETRAANRQYWYEFCNDLRKDDAAKLSRMVLLQGKVAAGLRDKVELEATKAAGLFNRIVWIDRPGTPVDPTVTFGPEDCDEVLLNIGDLKCFHVLLFEWAINHRLPLKHTNEVWELYQSSKFYATNREDQIAESKIPVCTPKPFVPVVVKPFEIGNE
jgi:hypothetical protein